MSSDPRNPSGLGLLFMGIIFIIWGVLIIIRGNGGRWGNVPLVDWIGWIFLPAGVGICIMSIIWLRRSGGKSKKYTDEDVVRAKEELARMYFEEHGTWPKTDSKNDDS